MIARFATDWGPSKEVFLIMKLNIKIEDFNPALTPCLNTDCDRWDDDGCFHIRKAGKNHQRNKVETVFFIMKEVR